MKLRTHSKVVFGSLILAVLAGCGGRAEEGTNTTDGELRRIDDGEVPDPPEPERPPAPAPRPPPPVDPDAPIARGAGWAEYKVAGAYRDLDTGVEKTLADQHVVIVRGMSGVVASPLSAVAKNALMADVTAAASGTGTPESSLVTSYTATRPISSLRARTAGLRTSAAAATPTGTTTPIRGIRRPARSTSPSRRLASSASSR